MNCENCGKPHDGKYGSGRFCSTVCARGFSTSKNRDQINAKRSKTNKERGVDFTVRGPGTGGWKDPHTRAKSLAAKMEKHRQLPFEEKSKKLRFEHLLEKQDGCCALCGIKPMWNGKPLNFHIDHISGEHTDNSEENCRLVCPNCHSQTETYCGRNAKLKREKMVPRVGIEPTTNLVLESSALPLS